VVKDVLLGGCACRLRSLQYSAQSSTEQEGPVGRRRRAYTRSRWDVVRVAVGVVVGLLVGILIGMLIDVLIGSQQGSRPLRVRLAP
jgi:F0F1-type ATP synthase assembly protein I